MMLIFLINIYLNGSIRGLGYTPPGLFGLLYGRF